MQALRIEILDPKALKLIKGMAELKLIKMSKEPASGLKAYLKKMRSKSANAPDPEEIAKIVKSVRTDRYVKKQG